MVARINTKDLKHRDVLVRPGEEPPKLLVDYKQLRGLGLPWSRVHLRRLCREGKFPQPLQLSAGRIAWRMSDLLKWLDSAPLGRGWPEGAQ